MSKLERIIGGNTNSTGGIDRNYSPTDFSIGQESSIRSGYNDTCNWCNWGRP